MHWLHSGKPTHSSDTCQKKNIDLVIQIHLSIILQHPNTFKYNSSTKPTFHHINLPNMSQNNISPTIEKFKRMLCKAKLVSWVHLTSQIIVVVSYSCLDSTKDPSSQKQTIINKHILKKLHIVCMFYACKGHSINQYVQIGWGKVQRNQTRTKQKM
jgi:hypothetical protein